MDNRPRAHGTSRSADDPGRVMNPGGPIDKAVSESVWAEDKPPDKHTSGWSRTVSLASFSLHLLWPMMRK